MIKIQTLCFIFIWHAGVFSQQALHEMQLNTRPHLLIYTEVDSPKNEHKITHTATDILTEILKKEKFNVELATESRWLREHSLKRFAAIIFLNNRGDVLNEEEQSAFKKYIQAGGGAAVIHAAMLTEEDWEWFRNLVATQFKDHPKIQPGKIINAAPDHDLNQDLPMSWIHNDEWYNYTEIPKNVTTLLRVDESSYEGGIHGDNHPVAWYHCYNGGRIFCTALGHTEESWNSPLFIKHIVNGIRYAAGMMME